MLPLTTPPDVAVDRVDEDIEKGMVDFSPLEEGSIVGGCFRTTTPEDIGGAARGGGGGAGRVVFEATTLPTGASIRKLAKFPSNVWEFGLFGQAFHR